METIYLCIIILLFVFAVVDLWVGVSNDAVNFLNSAIGARVASFKVIISVAAFGVLCGAVMSNGMMEVARHGIFQPQYFYFNELICIMLAVMITDVVLLDVFNSLGLPTSTTVSLVFELLGGTVALALIKLMGSDGVITFGQMINTDKVLSVIMAIFFSVPIAFFFGMIVQYITRIVFSFNYKRYLGRFVGLFGGIAITSIIYFMLIKGAADSVFMTPENKAFIHENTKGIVLGCFIFFTILMQIFYFLRISVLKVIVLTGTFALALAFAGNDLVNFIGVPLAGFSAYQDYVANSGGADNYTMDALLEPAKTPIIFLVSAGVIMVFSLIFSKKAQNVVKTSLNLSRQEEGEEMFGSSVLARQIVRSSQNVSHFLVNYTPIRVKNWINTRFDKDNAIMEQGASFDLLRASINLVLSGLLVALGTSLKLPLSTTYVTFMVAMGTSLADMAWGRESAVFRITGVISVIGGWFLTAGAAFVLCFIVAGIMYYGGVIAMCVAVALAFILLSKNYLRSKKENTAEDVLFSSMMASKDKDEVWEMLKEHNRKNIIDSLSFSSQTYTKLIDSMVEEDRKTLRKLYTKIENRKDYVKKIKRREMLCFKKLDETVAISHNTWFHISGANNMQILYGLKRMNENLREHLDNNFNPLPSECANEILVIKSMLCDNIMQVQSMIDNGSYYKSTAIIDQINVLVQYIKDVEMSRMKVLKNEKTNENVNVFMLYINFLQETQQICNNMIQLIESISRFQD